MIIRAAFVVLMLLPVAASANLALAPTAVATQIVLSKSLFVLDATNTFIANTVP